MCLLLCSDLDECQDSLSPCDVNAICSNTHGSYICSCTAGFTGDGKTCKGKINMLNKLFFSFHFTPQMGLVLLSSRSFPEV